MISRRHGYWHHKSGFKHANYDNDENESGSQEEEAGHYHDQSQPSETDMLRQEVDSRISNLESRIESHERGRVNREEFATLETRTTRNFGTFARRVQSHQEKIDALESSVARMDGRLVSQGEEIARISRDGGAAAAAATSEIEALKTQCRFLEGTLQSVSVRLEETIRNFQPSTSVSSAAQLTQPLEQPGVARSEAALDPVGVAGPRPSSALLNSDKVMITNVDFTFHSGAPFDAQRSSLAITMIKFVKRSEATNEISFTERAGNRLICISGLALVNRTLLAVSSANLTGIPLLSIPLMQSRNPVPGTCWVRDERNRYSYTAENVLKRYHESPFIISNGDLVFYRKPSLNFDPVQGQAVSSIVAAGQLLFFDTVFSMDLTE